jgi:hypothetical protein
MGIWANQQEAAHRKLQEIVEAEIPAGDTLIGAIHASTQSTFSVKFFAVGATDKHLIIAPLDKRHRRTDEPALVLRPDELDVDTVFENKKGVKGALSLSERGSELRFGARGKNYKFQTMGGTLIQNAMTSGGQIEGLTAVVDFLRAARS